MVIKNLNVVRVTKEEFAKISHINHKRYDYDIKQLIGSIGSDLGIVCRKTWKSVIESELKLSCVNNVLFMCINVNRGV